MSMRVLIDADACPVTSAAVSIAASFGLDAIIFSDTAHEISSDYAKTVTVDKGADSADFAILSASRTGDLVITGDYALAAMCLSKKALALRPDGTEYTDFNIDMMLEGRYIAKKIRSAGGKTSKIKKRTTADDAAFEKAMQAIIWRETEK